MKYKCVLLLVVIIILFIFNSIVIAAQIPPELLKLIQNRDKILNNLIQPVVACWQSKDTNHPVFFGCIDWHSSVHAAWSILAYTRVTGDKQYLELVTSRLSDESLAHEISNMQKNPNFEMPYGRAWFLRFAIESHRLFGENHVQTMAKFISQSLLEYYKKKQPKPISYEYDNDAWALINMIDYARECKNDKLFDEVQKLVKEYYMNPKRKCLSQTEHYGFMSVCTNWAWLVSKTVDKEAFIEWYNSWKSDISSMQPIENPSTPHEYGLNFSRAWGLLDLFDITLDMNFIKCYTNHFNSTYSKPSHWKGNYHTVGHWVSQFGILAAMPLYSQK